MWPERPGRDARRRRLLAILVSGAAHSLLFFIVVQGRPPRVPERVRPILLQAPPSPEAERAAPTPLYVPRRAEGRGSRPAPPPPVRNPVADTAAPAPQPVAPLPAEPAPLPRSPAARIGPALGDGRLWVRPLPLPPRELAQRLKPTHAELVDSAVTAIVQAYLDSIAREPGADRVKLPDWTTEVAGAKFGLDSRNIYIAGLKIPAAVLALLPLPAGGNQQRALDKTGAWIAEDLHRAAQRAATVEDFKRAIRDLRERREREREFERARRTPPDSTRPDPD